MAKNPTNFPTPHTSTCNLLLGDGSGYAIQAACTSTPPTTADIFQHGCLMYQTDSGTGSAAVYQNIGSVAVPSWALLESAAGGFVLPASGTDTTTTTGNSFALTQNTVTTGKGIVTTVNGLTTGKGIEVTHTTSVIASGGTLLNLSSTGVDTATTSGALLNLTSTASAAGTQVLGTFSGLTTGIGTSLVADALTTGQVFKIGSAATAMATTGRLFLSNHSGATGTSAVLNEFASAANDETVVLQVSASAALALGKVVNVSGAAVTTGTLVSAANADALTTGTIANFTSNSADTTARKLVQIVNDNTAAVGAVPLYLQQDAVGTTHFKTLILLGTIGIYVSDETSPNTALTAAKGSICLNGSATGQAFWNTDGSTAWTALA